VGRDLGGKDYTAGLLEGCDGHSFLDGRVEEVALWEGIGKKEDLVQTRKHWGVKKGGGTNLIHLPPEKCIRGQQSRLSLESWNQVKRLIYTA